MRVKAAHTLWLFVLDASCIPIYRSALQEIPADEPGFRETVQVRFLGVGGFSIRRGKDVILTAPLYSNPAIDELDAKKCMKPNVTRIVKFHPETRGVKAILVGHAHYDHLMDVPYVWAKTPDAIIYGNTSMKNILAGYAQNVGGGVPRIPPEQVVALDHAGANVVDYSKCPQRQWPQEWGSRTSEGRLRGKWVKVPGANVRIRALCSEHPAQILSFIHLWPGSVDWPRLDPPTKSEDYQEGETLAYLIDFLDDDGETPVFRVYYQDAPTNQTIGQVPEDLIREDQKPVDLALLCVGNFLDVETPTHIVENTRAPYIILSHWENFFRSQDRRLKGIPFANVRRVRSEVQKAAPCAEVYVPAPQTMFHFRNNGAGVEMVAGRQ